MCYIIGIAGPSFMKPHLFKCLLRMLELIYVIAIPYRGEEYPNKKQRNKYGKTRMHNVTKLCQGQKALLIFVLTYDELNVK